MSSPPCPPKKEFTIPAKRAIAGHAFFHSLVPLVILICQFSGLVNNLIVLFFTIDGVLLPNTPDDFELNSHILTASRLKMGKLQNYLKSRIVADTISKEYSSRLQYRVVNVAEL